MLRPSFFIAAFTSLALLSACGSGNDAPDDTKTAAAPTETVAETPDVPETPAEPGPAVGEMAPMDVEVTTADGEVRKIGDIASSNGTVLVFFRSADWCPYCKAQIRDIKEIADIITKRGYTLAAVSYDSPETLKSFAAKEELTFPLLSDKDSKLIDAFDIRDPQYTEGKAVGVPYASIFILDPSGKVLSRSVSSDYTERPTNDDILVMLTDLG